MTAHSIRKAPLSNRLGDRRRRLMWSCAVAAILVAGTSARKADAQAFQGDPSGPASNVAVSGTATRNITSSTTETITVGTPTATIDWTPYDNDSSGPIDFLPAGNVATFTNDLETTADFTVLNRIVPSDSSRPIELNGSVISQLQGFSEGSVTGGNVWFYSPGGIIVGATAVFDVGGLLLTTNDALTFSTTATGFTGNFVAGTDSTAAVTIAAGAQINATPENSYVAIVAPRVVQGGTVNVNGSAAYVAGEDVTLTMNQGLFDIAVNVGTSDSYDPDDPLDPERPTGIIHTGTTTGPSSTGAAGDNHRIYMVAVPKNLALTMLLSGNAGFQPAASASVVNGQIVLAAGSNVAETTGTLVLTSPNVINADLTIGAGDYTSDVRAFARGDIYASADDGFISFSRDVSLTSLLAAETGTVTVGATNGYAFNVGRDLRMQTSNAAFSSGAPEEASIIADGGTVSILGDATVLVGAASDGTPGDAVISARDNSENSGSISIGGTTFVSTSAAASSIIPEGDSVDSFAGDITVEASNGGSITLHDTTLVATANGQDNANNGSGFAGDAFGGNINIIAESDGVIDVIGNLSASADGIGGNMRDGGLSGGNGYGGWVNMSVADGWIDVSGNVFLSALGIGGHYTGEGSPQAADGGFGDGGRAIIASLGPGAIAIVGDTTVRADGSGGSAQSGGGGYGGYAGIEGYDGSIELGPTTNVSARGTGGNAVIGYGGNGGDGYGGRAFINANAIPPGIEQVASASTITGGDATIDATGTGGYGGPGYGDIDGDGGSILPGSGGQGFGGAQDFQQESNGGAFALAQVDGASLTLGNVTLLAQGLGGTGGTGGTDQQGGDGGNGTGGTTQAGLFDNPYSPTGETTGNASFGDLTLVSSGIGAGGGSSLFQQGDGGSGFGGDAQFLSFASNATALSISLFAVGQGNSGGLVGGDGYGGTITVRTDGGHIDVTNALSANANGIGLSANAAGTGGGGFGGDVDLTVNGGRIGFTGGTLSAQGFGGLGYTGGGGFGGIINASITDLGGLLAMNGDVLLTANATGGNGVAAPGGTGGTGGTGFGGDVTLSTAESLVSPITSTLQFGNLALRAHGDGGDGGDGTDGGAGGDGYGGTTTLALGEATVTGGDLTIIANGTGGAGGAGTATGGVGGYGEGGTNVMTLAAAGSINAAIYASLMDGLGGAGGAGGTARGVGGSGQGGTNSATIDGDATFAGSVANFNGFIVTTFAQGGDGLTGGFAQGGTSSILVNGSLHVTGQVQSTASGLGGNGGTTGGGASGGTATVTVYGDLTAGRLANLTNAFGGSGSAAGGSAQGGSSLFELPAGTGTATISSSTVVSASGTGGNSSAGDGGDGTGGDAHVKAHDGTHISAHNLSLAADGFGGNGVNGGDGEGGFIEAIALQDGALLTLTGSAILSASGYGGDGTIAGTGGHGFGGTAGLYAGINDDGESPLVGGTVTVVNATVRSLGQGGDGGLGGDGSGGFSQVGTRYGTLTVTGTLFGDAGGGGGDSFAGIGGAGFGGTFQATANFLGDTGLATLNLGTTDLYAVGVGGNGGGSGNAGGTGFGGLVQLLSPTAGSTLTATALSLHAGANGGVGGNGAVGGRGGDANGGHALVEIAAGNANLGILGSFARGVAGNGGTGSSGAGGAGGDGFAGLVELNVTGNLTATSYQGDAQANGGNGGTGTTLGAGGSAEGGSTYLNVYNGGDLSVTGDTLLFAGAVGGDGTTGGGHGFGGLARFSASNGAFADFGSELVLQANAAGGAAPVGQAGGSSEAGQAQLFATSSEVTAGDVTLSATAGLGGTVDVDLAGSTLTADSLSLNASGGTGGTVNVLLQSDFDYYEGATSLLDVGTFTATADGGTAGDIFVTVADGSLANLGVAQMSANGATGTGSINIDLGGASIIDEGGDDEGDELVGLLALDNTALTAQSLSLITSGDIDVTSVNGASIDVAGLFEADAAGALTLDDNDEGGVIRADVIDWHGNTVFNNFDLVGRVIGIAADLDLDAGDLEAGEVITLSAGTDLFSGVLSAGQTVAVTAGNDFTVGAVDAGDSATFTAGGIATFLGLVAAPTITVTSADIDIIGQLGEHGLTDLVTLNGVSSGPAILIGDDAGPQSEGLQYRLTNDELIHSDVVVFNVVNASEGPTPDVILAGLEMEGSTTEGGGVRRVELNTAGSVFVNGLALYTNAAATDELEINARDVQVNTSTGGRIAMVDSSEESPSGILEINSDNLWVGDQTLLDSLNANPNFAGRDNMVGTNSGVEVPEGYLIAGGMTLSASETLFVQNSGGPSGFAGITVGDGGLQIRVTGEAPSEVVAYGRQINGEGSFTTGEAFFNLVDFTFQEGSAFTDLSEFNECLINTGCGGVVPPPPPPPRLGPFGPGPESILGPVGEMSDPETTIAEEIGDSDGGSEDFASELVDTSGLAGDDVIDEGVTSGGDDNQWADPACSPDDKTDLCTANDAPTKQEPAQ